MLIILVILILKQNGGWFLLVPMKSIRRRPSLSLPAGRRKKDCPYGAGIGRNAADIAPVSEFESPKL